MRENEQNPAVEPDGLLVTQVQEYLNRFARRNMHAPSVAHLLNAFKDEPTLTQNALTDILWDWWGRRPALPADPELPILPPARRPRRYHVREMSGFTANRAVVDYWRSESGDECAIFFRSGLPDYVEQAQNLADLLNARHDENMAATEARQVVMEYIRELPNAEVRAMAKALQESGYTLTAIKEKC